MEKFECTVCDYIYDPEAGDPDSGVPRDTAFEELPDDWLCPVCSVPRSDFVPQEDEKFASKGAVRRYSRPGLTVIWQSALCNHNGNCTRSLPEVFDVDKRPWVDIKGAEISEIKRVIDECPTGALSYQETDGAHKS